MIVGYDPYIVALIDSMPVEIPIIISDEDRRKQRFKPLRDVDWESVYQLVELRDGTCLTFAVQLKGMKDGYMYYSYGNTNEEAIQMCHDFDNQWPGERYQPIGKN